MRNSKIATTSGKSSDRPATSPPYTVFDIDGNHCRVVVIVRYRFKQVFAQEAMMHRKYDDWNKLYRKDRVKLWDWINRNSRNSI